MAETDTILSAIRDSNVAMVSAVKESAAGTEKAIDRLARAIENIPAIAERMPKADGKQDWQAIVVMIAILAAVMSPALVMVSAQQSSITEIKSSQLAGIAEVKGQLLSDNVLKRETAVELGMIREKYAELHAETIGMADAIVLQEDRTSSRFDKLEEWQKWWYRTMPFSVALQEAKIDVIENQINASTNDRFYGREGTALGQRIGDIENSLRTLPPLKQEP